MLTSAIRTPNISEYPRCVEVMVLRLRSLAVVTAVCSISFAGLLQAENRVLAEVRFVAHNKAEKNAGVWVDGQYVGYVKELNGDKKVLLLPGQHEIAVRQAWYRDDVQQVVLEPGKVYEIKLRLAKDTRTPASQCQFVA